MMESQIQIYLDAESNFDFLKHKLDQFYRSSLYIQEMLVTQLD